MKIKLPFTEKFLWDVYKMIEGVGDLIPDVFKLKTMKEAFYPDLYQMRKRYGKKLSRRQFANLIDYLKRRGYLKIEELKNKKALILTPKGTQKILKIQIKLGLTKHRKDKKWQMVTFDIPEKLRKKRDEFRARLQSLGYKKFQKSIWICPYDILKLTQEVIEELQIEHYIKLFLIEEIEI